MSLWVLANGLAIDEWTNGIRGLLAGACGASRPRFAGGKLQLGIETASDYRLYPQDTLASRSWRSRGIDRTLRPMSGVRVLELDRRTSASTCQLDFLEDPI